MAHIPSFQAAIQLTAPLDDRAWALLKPRLLDQRAQAEQIVQTTAINSVRLQSHPEVQAKSSTQTKEAKEATEKAWDEAQGPLRARISRIADDIIRKQWEDGHKVTKKNSPNFAAQVLTQVRTQFYAELAEDTKLLPVSGNSRTVDPPGDPGRRN